MLSRTKFPSAPPLGRFGCSASAAAGATSETELGCTRLGLVCGGASGEGPCAAAAVAISVGAGVGAGAGALKAEAGSKEGLRDWTRRRKEKEETVLAAATSAGAAAMRETRPCGSESAAEGRGGGGAAAVQADVTGLGFALDLGGLGLGLGFTVAVCLGLGRGSGGGGGGGERPRGGEAETSEIRDPSESESPARSWEYIGVVRWGAAGLGCGGPVAVVVGGAGAGAGRSGGRIARLPAKAVASVERSCEPDRDLPALPRERIERLPWPTQPIALSRFFSCHRRPVSCRHHVFSFFAVEFKIILNIYGGDFDYHLLERTIICGEWSSFYCDEFQEILFVFVEKYEIMYNSSWLLER